MNWGGGGGDQSCSMVEEEHSNSKCPKQFSTRSGLLQHHKKELETIKKTDLIHVVNLS